MIQFEWDEKKNRANRKKHGVWFEEAQQVFDDLAALRYFDDEYSDEEDRFLMLGMSGSNRTLVVVFCERESPHVIRIISARKATKKEINAYEEGI
jgi:uncharacterized DUF497 family protein